MKPQPLRTARYMDADRIADERDCPECFGSGAIAVYISPWTAHRTVCETCGGSGERKIKSCAYCGCDLRLDEWWICNPCDTLPCEVPL